MSYAPLKTCEDCKRPSNNKSFNCPERMADGRLFTDYRPRCAQQYLDKINNQLQSSYDHRMFLIQNADDIMKKNALDSYMRAQCGPCVEPYDQGTMAPEIEKQVCNERTCSFGVNDPYGIGLGRQYYTPDIELEFKKKFLEEKQKEQDYFKSTAECCGTVTDNLQYFPLDGMVKNEYARPAMPGGGAPMTGSDLLA